MYLRVAFSFSVRAAGVVLLLVVVLLLLLLLLLLLAPMPMSARYYAASSFFHSSSFATSVFQSASLIVRLCTPSAPIRARYTSMSGFQAE